MIRFPAALAPRPVAPVAAPVVPLAIVPAAPAPVAVPPVPVAPAAPAAPTGALSARAMLVRLTLTQWSARKLDRAVTQKANSDHGAKAEAGRYNKALLTGAQLAAIVSAANAARAFHYINTLPWLDDGARILPAGNFTRYTEGMRDLRQQYDAAVHAFVAAYPAYVLDAQTTLGSMYDPQDYPDVRDIAGKFTFSTRVLPMPDAADFRVDIADSTAAAIRAEIQESTNAALEAAMADAWKRVTETVRHMVEKLTTYKPATADSKAEGVFRDSMVDNIRELVAILPSFNLTGDAFLADIAARMARDLCTHDAPALRKDDTARQETAAAAAAILADVSAYMA